MSAYAARAEDGTLELLFALTVVVCCLSRNREDTLPWRGVVPTNVSPLLPLWAPLSPSPAGVRTNVAAEPGTKPAREGGSCMADCSCMGLEMLAGEAAVTILGGWCDMLPRAAPPP